MHILLINLDISDLHLALLLPKQIHAYLQGRL